ncbi:MAG: hypothetical protein AB1457_13000 [Chloroflexota bacterium]|nr:MAG: hypothetical protein KatS3mg045_1244 [Bellilinea sp.]
MKHTSTHHSLHLLKYYSDQPKLTALDFPIPVYSVFNPAAVKFGDEYLLLTRVEDLSGVSCLWLARSKEVILFREKNRLALYQARPTHEPDFAAQ